MANACIRALPSNPVAFNVDNVPPGEYLLEVTSPRLGSKVTRVTVVSGQTIQVTIEVDVSIHREEVTVTASVEARTADEVASPVSVLSGHELQSSLQATLGETLNKLTGVNSTFYGQGASPYALSFRGDFEQTVLVLPGDLLAPFVRDLDRGCACVLPREAPATRLLAQLAAIAAAVPEPLPPHIAAGVGHLIAETLVAALPGNERHGLTQYHVARAKETALARLGDPGLSPAKIAAVTGLSTAHLHRLFAACGEAVMAWVWARRLEACRRDLEDPCYDGLPVAAIGFRWGYKTDAHFSRAFKVRYGATPGEWRRKQREGGRR